jgi:thiamine-monophosphate kinase
MPNEKPFGEFDLIRRLTADLPAGRGVIIGPGDDAAVVRPGDGMDLAITTDAFVEGRHYRRDAINTGHGLHALAEAVGRRLAAANLSDLAAMGARPRWAVLSIGAAEASDWIGDVEHAVSTALAQDGAALIGGNLARVEGAEWFSLALVGEVERDRAWSRNGAHADDLVAVTGMPGLAGALEKHLNWHWAVVQGHSVVRLRALESLDFGAWTAPASRVSAARALRDTGAIRAAIDLSDGVAGDLAHLCEASGVGAEIDAAWPDHPLIQVAEMEFERGRTRPGSRSLEALIDDLRFGPSDDYELLLAVDPEKRDVCERVARETHTPLTFVGRFTTARGALTLRRPDGSVVALPGRGYDHFASKE